MDGGPRAGIGSQCGRAGSRVPKSQANPSCLSRVSADPAENEPPNVPADQNELSISNPARRAGLCEHALDDHWTPAVLYQVAKIAKSIQLARRGGLPPGPDRQRALVEPLRRA